MSIYTRIYQTQIKVDFKREYWDQVYRFNEKSSGLIEFIGDNWKQNRFNSI